MHHPITGGRRAVATALALLALAAALLVPACSGGEESKPATDGADATTDSGQADTAPTETVPPSTVPDDEFANVIDGLDGQFDAAGDACELLTVISSAGSLPTPANPDQTKAATELLASALRRLSESPPPGQDAAAPKLAEAADQLIAAGEASGWDPEALAQTSAIGPDAQEAITAYGDACSLTAPGGAAGSPPGQPVG